MNVNNFYFKIPALAEAMTRVLSLLLPLRHFREPANMQELLEQLLRNVGASPSPALLVYFDVSTLASLLGVGMLPEAQLTVRTDFVKISILL